MQNNSALSNLIWNQNAPIVLSAFATSLVLAAVLSLILGAVYVRFGRALSNRKRFAQNFLLLTVTTTLVISIVKSSLALSLGLVGALSIVRFRAAIKEPEELAYLFLAISLGLGLGAGQLMVTVVAFTVILVIIVFQHLLRRKPSPPNLYLTITGPASARLTLTQIENVLRESGLAAGLQRYDTTPEGVEAAFRVAFPDTARVEQCQQRLRGLGDGIRVSYVAEREFGD
ncbi:MAG: DUF4956 domain-containing protein [Chloroflexi bacterium]|nr:DUF4956 domain-containing protein [Chloroflexota bacterium]